MNTLYPAASGSSPPLPAPPCARAPGCDSALRRDGAISESIAEGEEVPAAPSRDRRLHGLPPSGRSSRGEVIHEGDGEIPAELSGRMSPTDLPEQEDRGLSGGRSGGESGRPSPISPSPQELPPSRRLQEEG